MNNAAPLLSVEDAIAKITAAMQLTRSQTIALDEGHGRVLAEDIRALISHPSAAVSAMDGYAARSGDIASLPATLKVIGESAAGRPYNGAIGAGECVRIFTGAHCPDNADTIIIQENTESDGDSDAVRVLKADTPGRYIRPAGNDFTTGDMLAPAGMRLSARRLALIGSAGHGKIKVRRRPVIAVISTGDELVEPGATPKPHQIISSNGVFLEKLVGALGGEAMQLGIIGDSAGELDKALRKSAPADLIVTSGGASVGDHDAIAMRMAGEDRAFGRIAMRPGKPLIFGRVEGRPILALPGNPVSTGVCGMIFLASAIRAMLGQDPMPRYRSAVLGAPLGGNDARQEYLRASLEYGTDGRLTATALTGQDSGMMGVLARADALIMRPPHAPPAESGEIVPILILPEAV